MTNEKEQAMIDAHKNGRAAYHVNGSNVEMVHVIRQARKLYQTEHEYEAYIAGYIGELRRDEDMFSDEHRYKGRPYK